MNRRNTNEDDITSEVLRRIESTEDPRLRKIMQSLVRHLHAFAREVELTEAEWLKGIEFLTETGQMCSDKRQEFILLSDTLGLSMIVDLINHRKPDGATESTVFGPFHRTGAPPMENGGNIAPLDSDGIPTIVSGRVTSLDGKPVDGALLDVWQADSRGKYDSQYPSLAGMNMRGQFRSGKDGGFLIRTTRPVNYSIPDDGPVGRMLRATNRHSWRPAHIHFRISAEGYEPVTTHIFDRSDEYLETDAVFAFKESLMCEFVRHERRDQDAERYGVEPPFFTAQYDFVLKPAKK